MDIQHHVVIAPALMLSVKHDARFDVAVGYNPRGKHKILRRAEIRRSKRVSVIHPRYGVFVIARVRPYRSAGTVGIKGKFARFQREILIFGAVFRHN